MIDWKLGGKIMCCAVYNGFARFPVVGRDQPNSRENVISRQSF